MGVPLTSKALYALFSYMGDVTMLTNIWENIIDSVHFWMYGLSSQESILHKWPCYMHLLCLVLVEL